MTSMAPRRRIQARAEHGQLQQEVLAAVIELGECTVRQVHERIGERRPVAYTTVLTVMSRLAERGVLQRERRGNVGVFAPAASSDSNAAGQLVDQLIARFGAVGVSEFVERAQAHPELMRQLQDLIDEQAQ
jgi:predicted transcriptional regulator